MRSATIISGIGSRHTPSYREEVGKRPDTWSFQGHHGDTAPTWRTKAAAAQFADGQGPGVQVPNLIVPTKPSDKSLAPNRIVMSALVSAVCRWAFACPPQPKE